MSVINDTTQALGLPLPHPSNNLQDDVLRVRSALHAVDTALDALQQTIVQKADDATTVQALGQLRLAVSALDTDKIASVNGVAGVNIKLTPAHMALGPANGPSTRAFTYDGQGRVTQMTEQIQGQAATTAFAYDGQGRVTQVQTSYAGRMRTDVFTYDGAGRVASTQATEVLA